MPAAPAALLQRLLPTTLLRCAAVAVAVSACTGWFVVSAGGARRDAEQEKLVAIGELKARQVAAWHAEREGHAAALAANPYVGPAAARAAAGDAEAGPPLATFLAAFADAARYRDLLVVDRAGAVIASARGGARRVDAYDEALVRRALAERRVIVAEPHLHGGEVEVDSVVPLRDEAGAAFGVALLQSRARDALFPMVAAWPVPSATADAFLVRREGDAAVYLSPPRFDHGEPLRTRRPLAGELAQPRAGGPSTVRARDDRGVATVAAVLPVGGTDWSLVAKLDESELEAPVRELAASALAVAAAVTLLGWIAIGLAARRRAAELRAQDLERRGAADRELAASIVANLHEGVVAADPELRITAWNHGAERMYGYAAEEVIGRPLREVLRTDDHTVAERDALLDRARAEGSVDVSTRYQRKDGTPVQVEATFVVLRGPSGEVSGWVGVHRDVSEQRRLQARLAQSERMTSLGTLSAGMAHALNSPLASTIANVGYAREELAMIPPDVADIGRALDDAIAGARRAAEIVRSLQVFSRASAGAEGLVDLRDVVRASAEVTANDIRHRAQLSLDLAEVPPVVGDPGQLAQLCLQLLVNACQAIPEGHAAANVIRATTRTDDEGRAVLEISDTGRGIPPDIQGRIFDPFFTTEAVAGRSGLGLSVCHGIVTGLGGDIGVESEEGRGSTFRVRLPGAPRPTPTPRRPATDRGRVLVVDDEPLVLRAVERTLAAQHEVVTTPSARAALERLAAGEPFDAIVCDLMMPEMTGMELHAEVLRRAPEVAARMIFLTGGAFTDGARAFLERTQAPRLQKPFDPAELRALAEAAVRRARAEP